MENEKGQWYQNSTRVAQQSQKFWFEGRDDASQQKLIDSSICPSPLFTFDPPGYKRTWGAMKVSICILYQLVLFKAISFRKSFILKDGSGVMDTKHPAKNIEDKLSAWSQFPKLPKKDDRGV